MPCETAKKRYMTPLATNGINLLRIAQHSIYPIQSQSESNTQTHMHDEAHVYQRLCGVFFGGDGVLCPLTTLPNAIT